MAAQSGTEAVARRWPYRDQLRNPDFVVVVAQICGIDIEMLDEFGQYLLIDLGNRRRRRLHQPGGDAGDQVAQRGLLRCEA